jgi:enoyl-CoA hydratase/carnithine racemase
MIEIKDHGPIRELRLARPPVNALNPDLMRHFNDAFDGALADGARAIVISGQPGMFTAGLDVPELLRLERAQMLACWKLFFAAQSRLATSRVPVAAAITGHSPAGGAVLALYCDYRVMAEGNFRIGLNEVEVGLTPGPVICAVLRRVVGTRQADRLASAGLLLGPAEAQAIGLVDRVVPVNDVVPAAIEWAQGMIALPAHAVAVTRSIARADLIQLASNLKASDFEVMNDVWFSEETQSSLRALVARLKGKASGG